MKELGMMIPFSDSQINRQPEGSWISTIDLHTAGEPLRVVTGGYPEIKGNTLLEKRRYVMEHHDNLRTTLMFEPRGHADMYGCLLVPDPDEEVSFGVIFLHNEGYSSMCGHAVIALGRLAYERGWVSDRIFVINAPCGKIKVSLTIEDDKYVSTQFVGVPSFVLSADNETTIEGIGNFRYDLAYGGAFYAYTDVTQFNLEIEPGNTSRFIELGRAIKHSLVSSGVNPKHPFEEDLSFLYGVIFTGPPKSTKNYSRNVCVFADGEVDRSPTGSGVSGRLAIMQHRGLTLPDTSYVFESILGTEFAGKIHGVTTYNNFDAVIPFVSGSAHVTGEHLFFIDENDPLSEGFLLR